jgi:uncharacterized protein (DUF2126 family)
LTLHFIALMSHGAQDFDEAVGLHDATVRQPGLDIWVGAEPTFTDRFSEAPEWLTDALGADKYARAQALIGTLRTGAEVVLRTLGRQYRGEERPRWSLGLYGRRDGGLVWEGPPDPLAGGAPCELPRLAAFRSRLAAGLADLGWSATLFETPAPCSLRLAFRCEGPPPADPASDPRLARASVHARAIPLEGLGDELAAEGTYLVTMGCDSAAVPPGLACVEMPALAPVDRFLAFLGVVARAATEAGLPGLVLAGFPPPVDESVDWTTVTPDPAVLEVNMAPAPDAASFLARNRRIYAAARRHGLWPYRLHYNGAWSDSGGGGHITLGGNTPRRSPFFLAPHLLPRLVRYFNQHPALSYWFARRAIGASSQSPRPDENARESFEGLDLALELLEQMEAPEPELIWESLAPFLADTSGNAHRSEINIEKLWNPLLPDRGRLGLVEFRPFRMASSPEANTALAVLLRAVVAMLARGYRPGSLVYWGAALHDRFTLPFHLRKDLRRVLEDLAREGVGLGPAVQAELLDQTYRELAAAQAGGCRLSLCQALEPCPLVGDAASQESGGTRLVDSSTTRLELSLRPLSGLPQDLDGWYLVMDGYRVPFAADNDQDGAALLRGLRYRSFVPWRGLYPMLGAQGPLHFNLVRRSATRALDVTWHDWRPDGGAYEGLPVDQDQARQRCAERFLIRAVDAAPLKEAPPVPEPALTAWCVDLRRLGRQKGDD